MLYSSHWAGQLTRAFTLNFRIQTLDSQNQISHVRLYRQGRVGAAGAAAARLPLHHEAHLRALAAAPAGQGVQVVRRKGVAAFVARVVRLPFEPVRLSMLFARPLSQKDPQMQTAVVALEAEKQQHSRRRFGRSKPAQSRQWPRPRM